MGLKYFLLGTSLICGLVISPALSSAASELSPRAEVSVKGGSERSTLTTEFWAPLAQKSDRVVYTDLRLMGDDDDNREGNLGIGYRQIYMPTNSVLGVHGWIDRRRTEHNSTFHQVTFGVESLGDKLDLRLNGYVPLNDGRVVTTPNLGSATPYLAGNGLFYDITGSVSETPQYGLDAEAGYRLPICESQIDALRIYGGSYYFFRDNTESVLGGRARIEAQINQLVSVGARFQYDKPRGSQGFLEATLRFPFSAKKLYQKSGLASRLDESPERDIDIVTSAKVDTGLHKEILNTSGTQQRILYVDNTQSNGDGTKEHPFNNLQSAQQALQANDILYIFRGDGTTHNMDQGITISQSGVQLIGSGSPLTVSGYTFLNAGSAPLLTNTQAPVDTFTGNAVLATGANIFISGISVSGATRSAINIRAAGISSDYAIVQNVTSTGNVLFDVAIKPLNGGEIKNVTIDNVSVQNSISSGVSAEAGSKIGMLNIINSNFNSNAQQGMNITGNGGEIGTVNISNTNFNGNALSGLLVQSLIGGKINNVNMDHITVSNNIQYGVWVSPQANTQMGNVQITNSNILNNLLDGIRIVPTNTGSSISSVLISGTNIIGNRNGVYIIPTSNSVIGSVSLSSLQILNNTSNGIIVDPGATTTIGLLEMNHIISNNNGISGVNLNILGGLLGTVNMSDVIANNNVQQGIYVQSQAVISNLNINGAITNNNGQRGTYINPVASGIIDQISLNNITSRNNVLDGVLLNVDGVSGLSARVNQATITNITATGNRHGMYMVTQNGGTLAAATLSNINGNNNLQNGIYFNAIGGSMNNISLSNSTATGNANYGVYVNDDTTGAVLFDLGGGTLGSVGQNRIFGNTSSDIRVDVDGGQLKAKNNWWGVNTGLAVGKVSYEDASTIDSTAFLTTDPRP